MNKVQLIGRLVRDPELRQTNSGTEVCRFTVACDRRYKKDGGQQADFPNCVAFGKTANFIQKYFTKGKPIGVVGHIQTGSYEKDGRTVYTTDVVVDEAEFVAGRNESGGSAPAAQNTYTNSAGETRPIPGAAPAGGTYYAQSGELPLDPGLDFEPMSNDELPF